MTSGRPRWRSMVLLVCVAGCQARSIPKEVRIDATHIAPPQRALSVAVWGSGAEVELYRLAGAPGVTSERPGHMTTDFTLAWNARYATWASPKPKKFDWNEIGFWRVRPQLVEGPKGWAQWAGQFFRVPRREPSVPEGWRVVSKQVRKMDLKVAFPNPAMGGGGALVTAFDPDGWSLRDIGFEPSVRFAVGMETAKDSPYSVWSDPKPAGKVMPREDLPWWSMEPRLIAEVTTVVLEDAHGTRRTVEAPTGWLIAAGRFFRSKAP